MKLYPSTPPLTPVDDDEVARVVMREPHTLPNKESWPNRPLMICLNSPVSSLIQSEHGLDPHPIGVPFKMSSDVFEGTMLVRLKGSNSHNPDGDEKYFSGRKRICQIRIQGRFKEENVQVSDVMFVQEFVRPLKNLPNRFIVKLICKLASRLATGFKMLIHDDKPSEIEAVCMSTAQTVSADEQGKEPNIFSRDITENCSRLGGLFSANGNVSSKERRRIFSDPNKCQNYTFDTNTVYTFDVFDDKISAIDCGLDLGITTISLEPILDGQPLQISCKLKDGRYLFSYQIWHEMLLPKDDGCGKSVLLDD